MLIYFAVAFYFIKWMNEVGVQVPSLTDHRAINQQTQVHKTNSENPLGANSINTYTPLQIHNLSSVYKKCFHTESPTNTEIFHWVAKTNTNMFVLTAFY